MTLEYAAQSVGCDQSAASSAIDTYEDSTLFSSDMAGLYGSGELRSSTCTTYAVRPGIVHLQNDWHGGTTDAQVPIDPILSITSGFQNHSCQPSSCAIGQILNASQCRGVIFWLPCAPDIELWKAILQGGSDGCPEDAKGNTRCCLPEKAANCLQYPRGSEHTHQSFLACHDHDQCPTPPNGTLNPSTLSLRVETTNILQPHYKCSFPACKQYFKRQRTLDRHLKNHLGERLHVCWFPRCQRSFSRSDNLKAHYTTHGTHGGRNRYVATLDKKGPVYDPKFRGQLTPQG